MKLLVALLVALVLFQVVQGAGLFSIGYYAYYEKGTVPPNSIDYSKMTHIAIGAVTADASGTIIATDYTGNLDSWATFVNEVTTLANAVGTKTILMFGGAGYNYGTCPNGNFNLAARNETVQTFAQNLVNHAKAHGFAGIDIDWEDCVDWAGIKRLAQKIREIWPSCLLTLPVGALEMWTNGGGDPARYAAIAEYLDAINLMSYSPIDNWGGWDGPGHVSPLKGETTQPPDNCHPYSIQMAVNAMRAVNIPASKIGIGMGFFGSCWGSPITQPIQSLGTNSLIASDNFMSYRNIEASYRASMTDHYDTSAESAYLSSNTNVGPKGCSYISYDNDRSIKAKADYVKANGLAGIIIWTVAEGVLVNGSQPALTSVATHFGTSYTPITWPTGSTGSTTSSTGAKSSTTTTATSSTSSKSSTSTTTAKSTTTATTAATTATTTPKPSTTTTAAASTGSKSSSTTAKAASTATVATISTPDQTTTTTRDPALKDSAAQLSHSLILVIFVFIVAFI